MGRNRRSSSRSSSPERVDRFGRSLPKRRSRSRDRIHRTSFSRHRSRSPYRRSLSHFSNSPRRDSLRRRSRSRSRDRHRPSICSRSHSRDRHRIHRRSRSRGRSPIRRRSPSPPPENITSIDDPELLKSRIFIGNLPVDKVTKEDLEEQFSKYGKLIGVSIHERGFGFVQYEKESEALQAVSNENGGLLKGKKLDIKMALEGRRGLGNKPRRPSPQTSNYEGSEGGYAGSRDGRGAPPPARGASASRERSPLRADPYEDRFRDPYREPPLPPPTARRDDPYYAADPYRRPPPPDDPYYDRYRDDPYRYRRDPYGPDPYRDPYRDIPPYEAAPPPARKPLPIDCHIILTSAGLRSYGDFIERKIKTLNLFVNSSVIAEDKTIPQVIEEASKRGVLFAIVVNSQNEVHQSLTLNILHGSPQVVNNHNDGQGPLIVRSTPQEHRNMPVEDAVSLIGRSFEQRQKTAREKEAPPPAAAAPTPPFVPPGPDITYLLNLLADNRQLTLEELDKVIGYLRQRRDKMLEAEGRLPPSEEGQSMYGGGGDRKEDAASLQKQQQDLQAKILSILNGPGESSAGGVGMGMAGPAKGVPPISRQMMDRGMGNGQVGGPREQGMSSLINFDNPSVQKALDNLISSGPNLLKNISSAPPGVSQTQPLMSRDGGMVREMGEMRRDPHMMARVGEYGGANSAPGSSMQTAHMQAPQRGMFAGGMQNQSRGQMGVRPPRF